MLKGGREKRTGGAKAGRGHQEANFQFRRAGDDKVDGSRVTQVRHQWPNLHAILCRELLSQLSEHVSLAGHEHQIQAALGQLQGKVPPDATGGTGDHRPRAVPVQPLAVPGVERRADGGAHRATSTLMVEFWPSVTVKTASSNFGGRRRWRTLFETPQSSVGMPNILVSVLRLPFRSWATATA